MKNVVSEPWQWLGGTLYTDIRCAIELVNAIAAEGFEIFALAYVIPMQRRTTEDRDHTVLPGRSDARHVRGARPLAKLARSHHVGRSADFPLSVATDKHRVFMLW